MPVRRDNTGRWRYREMVRLEDGTKERISGTAPRYCNTKNAAKQALHDHVERLLRPSSSPKRKVVPTFDEFAEIFMRTYVDGNNKLSEIESKQRILDGYVLPRFGPIRLDALKVLAIEEFKAELRKIPLKNKSVNNVLTVLKTMLGYAEEVELLERAPRIKLLKVGDAPFRFLDFDEYEALLVAARDEPEWYAAILLGGDAGLRLGEIRGLQWNDWQRELRKLRVERAFYKETLGATKGYNLRTVPLTQRLHDALVDIRQARPFVLSRQNGGHLRLTEMRTVIPRLCRKAGIDAYSWHPLRHTFCSHLAMKGAPAKTIQELAGHADLSTTLKYMHLVEGAKEHAIALLEAPWQKTGKTDKSSG